MTNSFLAVALLFTTVWLCKVLSIHPAFRRRLKRTAAKLVIVLGSGGHTAEMLRLLESLDFAKYTCRVYIVSHGDALSESKARTFETWKLNETAGVESVSSLHDVLSLVVHCQACP